MKPTLFIFLAAAGFAQSPHQHHAPGSAEEYIRVLNDPQRDSWQKPHELMMALNLKGSDVVADIGAGSGYFSRRFAHHAGKVYAVDIDPKLVEASVKDAPKNVEGVLAASDDPKLPPGAVDLIFFCDVLHHIENRAAYYSKIARALKPGGRVVVVDFYKKPLPVGPPEEMKISEKQMIEELKDAGFRKTKSFDFLPYQYFLIFAR
ncbi:MAG: class I SAM-dependent methyltransferase [Bryobacteraceae bacterium]